MMVYIKHVLTALEALARVCLLMLTTTVRKLGARDEVVAACPRVCDGRLVVTRAVEDDTVRARAASGVRLEAAKDRELEVWRGAGEVEALAVVVLVRVVVRANSLSRLVIAISLLYGFVNVFLPIADFATRSDAGLVLPWGNLLNGESRHGRSR